MKCFRLLPVVAAAVALFCAFSRAEEPSSTTNGSHKEEEEKIVQLVHEWLNAALKYDTDHLSRLWADQWVEVHPEDGKVVNKKPQLADFKASGRKIDELHADDIKVQYLSEHAAILTDTTTIKAHIGGKEYNGKYRFLRVFVKQAGQWRAAGAGATPITSNVRTGESRNTGSAATSAVSDTTGTESRSQHQGENIEQQLKDLDGQWLHAAEQNDTTFLAKLFTDRMFEILPDGSIITGSEMLNIIGGQRHRGVSVDDIRVHGIYPEIAVLTDRTTLRNAIVNGRDITGQYRVMRIFVKQQGKWRGAAADMTPIVE